MNTQRSMELSPISSQEEGEIPMMPMPLNSTYAQHPNHHQTLSSNDPYKSEDQLVPYKRTPPTIRYKECLKNHAAAMGGTATDGCGEFLPGGEDGTPQALTCSACSCHRNFHRKETDRGDMSPSPRMINAKIFLGHLPPHHHQMIMPYSSSTAVGEETNRRKKRFRTKFSQEQKEKMLGFAERVGWKMQKQEEGVVQQFCQEVGVKRRVLKVWMHNNKHHYFAKKSSVGDLDHHQSNLDLDNDHESQEN